jgi:site-specific recombinase XerD
MPSFCSDTLACASVSALTYPSIVYDPSAQMTGALHVPLGKLKTERFVPVDSFVCRLVDRLRLLRSQDLLPADGFLLARPSGRNQLIRKLRIFWRGVVATVGIPERIVPHQLRHSFGTEMLRAGVSLPAVMKLLGHLNPR